MAAGTLNPACQALAWPVALRVRPMHPDGPCGDAAGAWCFHAGDPGVAGGLDGQLLAIIDGLGHGEDAARAADETLACLAVQPGRPLPALLAEADRRLASLRGAAVGLLHRHGAQATYAAIGNTRCLRWRAGQSLRLPSQAGIVGGGLPRQIQQARFDLAPGDRLLMFTDGLDERLHLPLWLPEWERDPGLLCEHLLDQARPGRDDAGILVAQAPPADGWAGGATAGGG